jgi:quercetin dioxygenase-like cupin family protein
MAFPEARRAIMKMDDIPFSTTDWSTVPQTEHKGATGTAHWRTRQCGTIRVRLVEYSPGYLADHWCHKGHILFCLDGRLDVELSDGRRFTLTPGMSYEVGDDVAPHRSTTAGGAKLFIVD